MVLEENYTHLHEGGDQEGLKETDVIVDDNLVCGGRDSSKERLTLIMTGWVQWSILAVPYANY